ncbi:MAG: hypothetical protein KJS98_02850 [Nitrospirae bacterium]|nr:hypothetical protein [Nitrospirota bacterium]
MTRKCHTEAQIIAALKDAQAGVSVQDLCRIRPFRTRFLDREHCLVSDSPVFSEDAGSVEEHIKAARKTLDVLTRAGVIAPSSPSGL